MNQIPKEIIEDIRKSNDITDIVGEYVQLKKQGKNFLGLCPFHNEKTPSFSVTQEKQIFHCFGCGKGGNVITFVMEMEGYSFFEAVKYLANRSGVKLPETAMNKGSSFSQENQSILNAYEWLTKLYHHLLKYTKDGNDGYTYFKDRGIQDDTIDLFKLGFAPNVKDFTAEFLKKKGFHQQMLVKAGLLSQQQDNTITDRFRGRVIYPIRNHLGKTVAFGGRSITEESPKYLNSSESELFQKGKLLYNFDLAKKHIRKSNEVILFEGYMDVISAYQAGVKNVVATLGTALTESQAKLLKRYVETVIICYDADSAGIEATYKAASLLRQVGCHVKIAKLMDGTDPDSFINKYGGEIFLKDVIKTSDTFIKFYMGYLKKSYNLALEGDRILYIEEILKELATLESSVEREYYLRDLSNEHNLSMDTLVHEVENNRNKLGKQKDKSNKDRYTNKAINYQEKRRLLPAYHNAERQLIAYMLQDKSIAEKVQEAIGASFIIEAHKIIATYLYAYFEEGNPADVSSFIEKLDDEQLKQLVIEIAMIPIIDDVSDKVINDYIQIIHSETEGKADIVTLMQEQKLAEQQNDPIKAAQIAMKIIELQKKAKQLN